jgi:type II secretory pathway pseudopilin PulG
MKFYRQRRHGSRNDEQGYILLTLLLVIALMIIFAAAIAPSIAFDMKRDREAEMIHRGCQYSRAIRAYYRKFGRYPVKLEDLENTNNIRFLRKRYKDPENCKNGKCADFKLLHFGEVQMALSMGGGQIPGATPVSAMGQSTGSGTFGQSSTFGSSSGFGSSSSSFGSNSGSLGSSSSFGQSQTTFNPSGTDSSQSQPQVAADGTTVSSSGTPGTVSGNSAGSSEASSSGSPQIIGGPIVGVASLSKEKTIREYNKKKVYKDWAFVYDPTLDQGLLITTPYQPTLQSFNTQNNLNGQNGQNPNGQNPNGQNGTSSGFGNSFGSSNGFGSSFGNSGTQNPSPNGGFGQPSNPNPPPQQ